MTIEPDNRSRAERRRETRESEKAAKLEAKAAEKTAAILLRVSTKEQTIENQRAPLEDLAADRGLKIVRRFDLKGKSAYKGKQRPALEEALAAAEAGEFSHFLIWSLDRLSREGAHAVLPIVERLSEAGVKLISYREPWLEDRDSDMQPALVAIWAQLAHAESKHKGARVTAARLRLRAEGKWPGGAEPYGYARAGGKKLKLEDSKSGREGVLEVYEPEAEVVRLIYSLYVHERLGDQAIARYLNDNGYGVWWTGTVWRILGRDYTGANHHIHENVLLPQIVDTDTWNRAQALIKANKRKKPAPKTRSPLQGIVSCRCGGNWRIQPAQPKKQQCGRMYCVRRHRARPGMGEKYERCTVPSILLEEFQASVLQAFKEVFSDHDLYVDLLRRSRANLEARIAELEREAPDVDKMVAEMEEDKVRLVHLYQRRLIGIEALDREVETLDAKQAILRERFPENSVRQAELETQRALMAGLDEMVRLARVRKQKGIPLHEFSFNPALPFSDEAAKFTYSEDNPLQEQGKTIEEQLEAITRRLDVSITVHPDCAVISGPIPLEVPLPRPSDSPHASRGGR